MNLLIIEDSERLCAALHDGLSRMGYAVDIARTGPDGLAYARHKQYDVIILDLMLPQLDGLSILRTLRAEQNPVHILILSAKGETQDRVRGLQQGADDYLAKPFSFDELCARIASLIRRKHQQKNPVIQIGSVTIQTDSREVLCGGKPVHMTPGEYAILEILAFNRGRVLSLDQLVDAAHDSDTFPTNNVVQVMICNVRKKLAEAGASDLIQTRRGAGYMLPRDTP